jgi:hypothetical protein
VLLLFEDIDGVTPAEPWRPDELARVLAAMTDLAGALTPALRRGPGRDHRRPGRTGGILRPRLPPVSAAGPADGAGLFQRAQGAVALEWLKLRAGWP